jgi:hypothetical protein
MVVDKLGVQRSEIFDFAFWRYIARNPEGDFKCSLSKHLNMTVSL